jgi:CHAT domain-containing protein
MPENVLAGVTAHAGDVGHLFQEFEHVTSRGDWFSKAHDDDYDVLYFLSHGAEDPNGGGPMIILDAPDKPGIRRKDLRSHNVEFKRRHPLVVLNVCDTAALEPDKAITLVEGFTYYGASAVIGTEITIFTGLAYAFGTKFLDAFVGGASLGAAVRQARLDLLRRWNPLGLAYVAYGLHEVRMAGEAQERPAA